MWREFATIRVGVSAAPLDDQFLAVTSMSGSGSLLLGGRRYRAEWSVDENQRPGSGFVVVPDELLRFPLDLRARRPGDRIRLATGSRTLKRLFNDRRVPKGERGRMPVLASGNTVLWAYGLAVAYGLEANPAERRSKSALTVRIVPTGGASGARTEICNDE